MQYNNIVTFSYYVHITMNFRLQLMRAVVMRRMVGGGLRGDIGSGIVGGTIVFTGSKHISRACYSIKVNNFYQFFPTLFPHGGPPEDPFAIDARALKSEFLRLQNETHPDRVQGANEELRKKYETRSSHLNIAYKALLDPLQRAQHVLLLHGIDALAEKDTLTDEDLLIEVLIAREAISEVSSEEELRDLERENNEKLKQSERVLEEAFKNSDFERAKLETIKLSYWQNIKRQIDETTNMMIGDD